MSDQIYLSRLVPNLRSREARRDLADCMAMHRTLMSAFPAGLSSNGAARAEAGLLYRVEAVPGGAIELLVQSAATRLGSPASVLAASR
jgi:CRISPR system Cascade subunit CasE